MNGLQRKVVAAFKNLAERNHKMFSCRLNRTVAII